MSKLIEVTVLKPHLAPNGIIVQRGEKTHVDESRYKALLKRGYIANPGEAAAKQEDRPKRKNAITNQDFEPRRSKIVGAENQ